MEFKDDVAEVALYLLLGLCDFVRSGWSRKINITWILDRAISARYLRKTNKLLVRELLLILMYNMYMTGYIKELSIDVDSISL